MALSIKSPAVDSLVREICGITGESLTSAIEVALRERLARLETEQPSVHRQRMLDWQSSWVGRAMPTMAEWDSEHYDDAGLPR